MSGQTPIYGLRFPRATATPNVPRDVRNLAEDTEAELNRMEGETENAISGVQSDITDLQQAVLAPACKLVNTSTQSGIQSGVITPMTFDTTLYDTDGMADLPNNQIVIQTAGIYIVSASVRWSVGSGERIAIVIQVNGNSMGGQAMTSVSGTNAYSVHAPLLLNVDAVVTGCAFQTSGDSASTSPGWDTPYLAASWIGSNT